MSHYRVDIERYVECQSEYPTRYPDKTMAVITIKPPVQVGEALIPAALGGDAYGISLRHLVTTDEYTAFVAESSRSDNRTDRMVDIRTVASRLGQIANTPTRALDMLDDNPFPEPLPL